MIKILHIARTERCHPTFRNFIESLSKYEHIVVSTTEPVSLRSVFNIKYAKLKLKALTILMKVRPDIIIVREYFGLPLGLFITFIAHKNEVIVFANVILFIVPITSMLWAYRA